jgi:hypothetical protein
LSTFINMELSMALKGQISLTILTIVSLALGLSLCFLPQAVGSAGSVGARPSSFRGITQTEVTVDTDVEAVLRGVSIHAEGSLPVVQQPLGDTNYVSKNDGEVTQFASASRYGNIGLLAHNYLSGKFFSQLRIGEEVQLIYSDGRGETFVVMEILRYQALDPKSPYSSFQNLDNQEEILTVGQMFDRAYQGGRHVTFQTCIAAEGNSSWGRLFIIAAPKTNPATVGFDPASLAELP